MPKKKNPYQEYADKEKRDKHSQMRKEAIFLTRKVASNPLASGYYTQIKDLLEDLLMLDLAQKAAEAQLKYQTRNKVLVVDDNNLAPFRAEMERAKTLKLVTGVLSLSGHLDVESVLDKVANSLYAPNTPSQESNQANLLSEIKKMLDSYAKKMETLANKGR